MVLTKDELIASLRNEVRILLHLAGKVDRAKFDYRPTAKQHSTLGEWQDRIRPLDKTLEQLSGAPKIACTKPGTPLPYNGSSYPQV